MTIGRKVLITATNYPTLCSESKELFEKNGWQVIENMFGRPMTFDELKERVGDIDAVVAGVDTWSEAVFQLAPKLKIISRFGVGVDNIDVKTARRFGIKVTNASGKNANAVAELTIGLLLAAMRNIPSLHQAARRGIWDRFVGEELVGRTVGFLGFGTIAQKVTRKLSGFDVKIIAYDKYPNLEAAKKGSFEQLVGKKASGHLGFCRRGAAGIGCGQPFAAEFERNSPFHECADVRIDEERCLFHQYGTRCSGGRECSL